MQVDAMSPDYFDPPLDFARPEPGTYGAYYQKYVDLVPDGDMRRLLPVIFDGNFRALRTITSDRERHRYAPGKWSIREAVGHMIDTERVFSYRALRIARGDTTPLASFDENRFVAGARYDEIPLDQILSEMMAVHASTILLFENMADDAWDRIGTASDNPVSVRALAYLIAGHELHHMNIFRERYDVMQF
ncbi:MAG TPA: DinB family protein [Gemmatimonadaceae bacterium]|nr:DinB family protein [Gemmatimonadaceae bacterium]